jgi:molybdopterin molybdotransferase
MIQISKALKLIDQNVSPLGAERVAIELAAGRVLAEDIFADSDLPPFDRSQMDGYALRAKDSADAPVILKLVGESAAGKGWRGKLQKGEAVRIMTGAPVPEGADSVQKVELTTEADSTVTLAEPTEKGRYIVKKGSEVKKGERVLAAGTRLEPNAIAVPAAFGYSRLKVARRPRVAILSTGAEIVEISRKPKSDQIRNSNSIMLAELCRAAGATPTVLPGAGDDLDELKARISAAAGSCDILITTGGVSVGKYDLTKKAFAELGATVFFDRVKLKPGKPTVFARRKKTLIFGLPGNPVSAAVTFYLFVRRALMIMQAANETELPSGFAVLASDVKGTRERESYLPARLGTDSEGKLLALPLRWHGSSDLIGFAQAEALIRIPQDRSIEEGQTAEILFLP